MIEPSDLFGLILADDRAALETALARGDVDVNARMEDEDGDTPAASP